MINFITKYNLLNPAQYGFHAGSTADAICNVVNYITEQLDCGNDILGSFIDARFTITSNFARQIISFRLPCHCLRMA